MVPSTAMSPLVRQAQEQLNINMRQMVGSANLMANPMMPAPNLTASQIAMQKRIMQAPMARRPVTLPPPPRMILKTMLPDIVWENVYRCEEAHLDSEDCEFVNLTFYNNQAINLKMRIKLDSTLAAYEYIDLLCDDFEEWKAHAIMMCEAGEDIWPRPTPEPAWQASSQNLGAASFSNLQAASLQQGAGNPGGAFGQAAAQGSGLFGPTHHWPK